MRVAGRAALAQGRPLQLAGRVLAIDGTPLAGATLELWQCDIHGEYHHVGGGGTQDENFQGYGRAIATADGSYAFVAMRPVPYGGRPAHLHFRITRAGARPLTTQLYLKGEAAERGFGGMFSRERERLLISPEPAHRTRCQRARGQLHVRAGNRLMGGATRYVGGARVVAPGC